MLSKEIPYICTLKKADPVAQLVEQYTFNVWALGSNPSGITLIKAPHVGAFFVEWREKFIFQSHETKKVIQFEKLNVL